MTDRDLDELLGRGAGVPPDVDPALLDRISKSIEPSLRPVRPLAPKWALESVLFLTCAAAAIAVAAFLGLNGIRALEAAEIAFIFPMLGLLTWMAAVSSVGAMSPGSASRVPSAWCPAIGSLALFGLFAALFHDYRTDDFVPRGIACLTAGLATAVPAGGAVFLALRRGFAVNRHAAGLAAGALAGLAGVTMLELHCPNLQALHILVWHTAVLPLSGFAGLLLAKAFRRQVRNHRPEST